MEEEKYEDAIQLFESLEGYRDSTSLIEESNYNIAITHKEDGKFSEAMAEFLELRSYEDSEKQAYECSLSIMKQAEIGRECCFGKYEQNGVKNDGSELIEWIIIDKNGSDILLLSKYALLKKAFDSSDSSATWESCDLRSWLNDDFYNMAFDLDERKCLTGSPDKVFLLNPGQVDSLSISEKKCSFTEAAYLKHKIHVCHWWLMPKPKYVDLQGNVREVGALLELGIRPAILVHIG